MCVAAIDFDGPGSPGIVIQRVRFHTHARRRRTCVSDNPPPMTVPRMKDGVRADLDGEELEPHLVDSVGDETEARVVGKAREPVASGDVLPNELGRRGFRVDDGDDVGLARLFTFLNEHD